MPDKALKPLFTWRSAILESDLPATARHLALTLSTYMNEAGGSAFPGADRLARNTGLSRVSVMKWRKALTDLGWLVLTQQGGTDKGGTRTTNAYEATVPANYATSWADAPEEFKDQKLTRDRSTSLTGQGDEPVKESADTGQPPYPVPVKDVGGTGQAPLPKHSIELSTEPSIEPKAPDVASDAGQGEDQGMTPSSAGSSKKREEPSHPNYAAAFDVIGAAFGLCAVGEPAAGLPVAARNSINRARKGAFRAGLLDDLALLADSVWVYRARPQCDIGSFAAAAADIALSPNTVRLVAHRSEAAVLVAEACAKLGLGPAGRALSQPAAEVAVALLLDGGVTADRVVAALRSADGWTHGQLQTELNRLRPVAERGVFPAAPDDLGPLLTLDLVGLLRRGLPPADVPRVAAELQDRVDGLTPGQRERMRVELSKDGFCSVNQIPVFVGALIRRLTPIDREREAKRAADMAVWGEIGAVEQPALPAGRGL